MQIRRQLLFVIVVVGLIGMSWMVSPPVAVQSALITNTPSPVPTDTPIPTDTVTPVPTPTDTPVSSTATNTPDSPTPVPPTNTPGGPTSTPGTALGTPDSAQTPAPNATPSSIPALGVGPDASQLMLFGLGLAGAILLLIFGWWRFVKKL